MFCRESDTFLSIELMILLLVCLSVWYLRLFSLFYLSVYLLKHATNRCVIRKLSGYYHSAKIDYPTSDFQEENKLPTTTTTTKAHVESSPARLGCAIAEKIKRIEIFLSNNFHIELFWPDGGAARSRDIFFLHR